MLLPELGWTRAGFTTNFSLPSGLFIIKPPEWQAANHLCFNATIMPWISLFVKSFGLFLLINPIFFYDYVKIDVLFPTLFFNQAGKASFSAPRRPPDTCRRGF